MPANDAAPAPDARHRNGKAAAQSTASRVFLLSPASCAGRRAALLFNGRGTFPLAERLRGGEAAPLGEVFSFLSGLYFRGKLNYADTFASPPHGVAGVWVITTNRGLLEPHAALTLDDLRAFGGVSIDTANRAYRTPLERDARALAARIRHDTEVVLLGSIASGKYVDILRDVFGAQLRFPLEFVGRGDMSRGGLMLRCVDAMTELEYVPIAGSPRRGARPPKLEPRRP
jgi:hypothetical protein